MTIDLHARGLYRGLVPPYARRTAALLWALQTPAVGLRLGWGKFSRGHARRPDAFSTASAPGYCHGGDPEAESWRLFGDVLTVVAVIAP